MAESVVWLWVATAVLVGITADAGEISDRIEARVEAMLAAGVREEVVAADRAGASRTARAAIGFEQLLAGDVEETKRAQRSYARRQLTWMRRMEGVQTIDRTGVPDTEVAERIRALIVD